jgi:hypothetical protein
MPNAAFDEDPFLQGPKLKSMLCIIYLLRKIK